MIKKVCIWMFAAILTFCGTVVLSSCSSDDSPVAGGGGETTNACDVVFMYYGIGGENLDPETENSLATAAYYQKDDTPNVRMFLQYKYSAERHKTWSAGYQPSGEYGGAYRFEMNEKTLNPAFKGDVTRMKV